ncbi:MAG: sulfite exporter TauE/SafE family protein [Deltaproteobacteria bacterium]|nr:sulfite exporter TauE/SafE family protein [Deltaproteobacteria bacterium]
MSFDILTIFGAGVLTFLTPCVLPLIPVYLAALTGGNITDLSSRQKGQLIFRALFFSFGFILVFTVMGLGASSIGSFLSDHKIVMQIIGALLILVFALKFLGLFNISFMNQTVKADDSKFKTKFGTINAFLMGIVFAAGWSPCVGPVLGSILTYTASTTSSPFTGALYLSIYGVGFALPLMITAVFAEFGMKMIGRISQYLPKIEKGIGVVLLFIAGMLVYDIIPDASTYWNKPAVEDGGFVADSASGAESDNKKPGKDIVSHKDGLPTMLELYREGCHVCKSMKPVVESIQNQCDQKGVHVKTLDVSKPENRHLIKKYRLVGVPTFIFLDESGEETARLVGEQSESAIKQTISVLRNEPCPGVSFIKGTFDSTSKAPSNNCNI